MNYRKLGRTGLSVSEIGFGALEVGRDWPLWRGGEPDSVRPAEAEGIYTIHEAIDLGVNFFDTAPAYLHSEALLGRALEGARRDKVILATKCGEWFDGNASQYNYSYDETEKFIEQSLRQLRTDRIDLLQIHSGNVDVVRRGETLAAMKKAQISGKIRFLGISVDAEDAALAAIENGSYDCIQLSYNLLSRSMEKNVIPKAEERNLGLIVKDSLAAGRLTTKFALLSDEKQKAQISKIAERTEKIRLNLAEYAIHFVLANNAVSTVIIGTKSPSHLRENIKSASDVESRRRVLEMEASQ